MIYKVNTGPILNFAIHILTQRSEGSKNASFQEIIIVYETKYLNKLQHFAKYLAKSLAMQNNLKESSI